MSCSSKTYLHLSLWLLVGDFCCCFFKYLWYDTKRLSSSSSTCYLCNIKHSLLMFASSLNILLPRWITQYFYYYYSCVVPIWIWIRKTDNTSMKAKTWGYFLAKKNIWIWYRQWITLTGGLEYSDGSRGFQSRRKLRMNQPLVFSIESKKWSSAKSSGKTILG